MSFGPPIARLERLLGRPRVAAALAAALIVAALAARLALLGALGHPGRSDYAFYLTVAQNLAAGRGFVVDYIWHYLAPPAAVTHYSNDYWAPLASVLIAGGLRLGGGSLAAAVLPGILAAALLAWLTYHFARALALGRGGALCAAALSLLLPPLFVHSLLTDAAIYYGLFAAAALLCLMRAPERPALYVAAGACAGLAHLCRQDGLLLAPIALAAALAAPLPWARRWRYVALAAGAYLGALAPWAALNLRELGSPLPPGALRAALLTSYEDLYAYGGDFSLRAYLDWGLWNILASKLRAAAGNLRELYALLRAPLGALLVVGAAGILLRPQERRRWRVYGPPALLLAGLFAFYTLAASFVGAGAFKRSLTAAAPFLVAVAVAGLWRLAPARLARLALAAAIAALLGYQSLQLARATLDDHNRLGGELVALRAALAAEAADRGGPVVLMARSPWELHYSTGYPAIQIPNNDLETIYAVARRYGATYLLLPAPRPALDGIASGARPDPRFVPVEMPPGSPYQLFRVE